MHSQCIQNNSLSLPIPWGTITKHYPYYPLAILLPFLHLSLAFHIPLHSLVWRMISAYQKMMLFMNPFYKPDKHCQKSSPIKFPKQQPTLRTTSRPLQSLKYLPRSLRHPQGYIKACVTMKVTINHWMMMPSLPKWSWDHVEDNWNQQQHFHPSYQKSNFSATGTASWCKSEAFVMATTLTGGKSSVKVVVGVSQTSVGTSTLSSNDRVVSWKYYICPLLFLLFLFGWVLSHFLILS